MFPFYLEFKKKFFFFASRAKENGFSGEFNRNKFADGKTEWMWEFIQTKLAVYFGFCAYSKINKFDSRNLEIQIFHSTQVRSGQVYL